jgi:Tol biopolymer transport system component
VPYLGGISAEWPAFSRDGKQAAWVAFPSRQLWRGNVDGSDATRLSESSFRAMFTQWFPDGKRILTTSERAGRPAMAYVVDATAGEAKALISGDGPVWGPTLSPDGRYAALHRPVSTDSQSPLAIFIYDLQEKKLSELPGSRAKLEPSWSPDGRYLAAFWKPGEKPNAPADGSLQDIALWDFQTRSWTPLLHSDVIDLWVWSKDSHSAWFGCSSDGLNAICRVSVPGGKVEKVLDTWRFHRADTSHSNFAGLTPEGDPLFMQVTHDFDLYSLEVELPK